MRRTGSLQKKRAEIRTRDRGHILHRYFFSSSSKRLGPPLCAKVWPRSPRDDHRHLASVASHQRVLSTSSFFLFFFFYFPHSFSSSTIVHTVLLSTRGSPTTTRPRLLFYLNSLPCYPLVARRSFRSIW